MDGNNIEAMVIYGLTDKPLGELTALNRSWNFAPSVTGTNGCVFLGYEKRERAFKFAKKNAVMAFSIQATQEQPLDNPAFVIANWGGSNSSVSLKLNGQKQSRRTDYRTGIEVDIDGTYTLVIWLPLSTAGTVSFEIGEDNTFTK